MRLHFVLSHPVGGGLDCWVGVMGVRGRPGEGNRIKFAQWPLNSNCPSLNIRTSSSAQALCTLPPSSCSSVHILSSILIVHQCNDEPSWPIKGILYPYSWPTILYTHRQESVKEIQTNWYACELIRLGNRRGHHNILSLLAKDSIFVH